MIYNMKEKREQYPTDCVLCEFYNERTKRCDGMGKKCNEMDSLTNTIIDCVTGLPINSEVDNGTTK